MATRQSSLILPSRTTAVLSCQNCGMSCDGSYQHDLPTRPQYRDLRWPSRPRSMSRRPQTLPLELLGAALKTRDGIAVSCCNFGIATSAHAGQGVWRSRSKLSAGSFQLYGPGVSSGPFLPERHLRSGSWLCVVLGRSHKLVCDARTVRRLDVWLPMCVPNLVNLLARPVHANDGWVDATADASSALRTKWKSRQGTRGPAMSDFVALVKATPFT